MKTNRFYCFLYQIMLGLLLLLVTILGQAQSAQGVIRGQVYQFDGVTPIGNATVEALGASPGTPYMTTTATDATGGYSLTLSTGSYRVRARAPGYASEYFNNVTPSNQVTVFNVTDGANIVADFDLMAFPEVSTNASQVDKFIEEWGVLILIIIPVIIVFFHSPYPLHQGFIGEFEINIAVPVITRHAKMKHHDFHYSADYFRKKSEISFDLEIPKAVMSEEAKTSLWVLWDGTYLRTYATQLGTQQYHSDLSGWRVECLCAFFDNTTSKLIYAFEFWGNSPPNSTLIFPGSIENITKQVLGTIPQIGFHVAQIAEGQFRVSPQTRSVGSGRGKYPLELAYCDKCGEITPHKKHGGCTLSHEDG